MADLKLNLEDALKALDKVKTSPPQQQTFDAPKEFKAEVKKGVKELLDGQRPKHRTALLWLVGILCALSFLLLASIVIFQMWKRLSTPDYVGVSDTVINILTGGVFGELIAVIAVIAKEVWKDPTS